ncbi:MAG: RNA polymerase sigma factor, partial [Thermoguttaceae bacterium]
MAATNETDILLLQRIRSGESEAWSELIARYEGRLLAFVESRARHLTVSEDLVQETFIGFLTSLPNYDSRRPLEGYLFSIASHKLIDCLRREGRRPALPLICDSTESSRLEPAGSARPASSIARGKERRQLEEDALVAAVSEQIEHWRRRGQWDRLK